MAQFDTQITNSYGLSCVGKLLTRDAVCVDSTATIHIAAQKMSAELASALLVMQDGNLLGIITDKDLRKRVLAPAISLDTPIAQVMTSQPITIDSEASVSSALLKMMDNNISHLPVIQEANLKGLITVKDIVNAQIDHPIFLLNDIAKQTKLEGLVTICKRVPDIFSSLLRINTTPSELACMMTNITDAVTKRLLALGFEKFGPAPIAYAWLALGSQARKEQTAKTDQDNALVLASGANQTQIAYFLKLAQFVNDGLDACGYVYCPGEIMASNPKWCQSVEDWIQDFTLWMTKPESKALMYVKIFFDLRCIDGEESLVTKLRNDVTAYAKGKQIFLSLLYEISQDFKPPIGIFKRFLPINEGEHKGLIDLKHNGLVPIVDLARIYMLSSGQSEEHTLKRLALAAKIDAISRESASSLQDAFEFISHIRMQHQGRQISTGKSPDNYIALNELSPLSREQLHAAFEVVANAQKALGQKFNGL